MTTVNLLSQRGIEHVISPPYTPQQNGTAERLPLLWKLLDPCLVQYILNRTGKTKVENKFPYELWYNRKVENLNHLKIFGTGCYVYVQRQFPSKLDIKSVFAVGYVNDKDGYRVWILSKNKIICSHGVSFRSETVCNTQPNTEIISHIETSIDLSWMFCSI